MSYIHIVKTRVGGLLATGAPGVLPVASSVVVASETIASSGTSQQSAALSISAPYSASYYVWQITNGGDTVAASSVPVYIVFGSSPTAVVGGASMRKLLMVNETFYCHAQADGEKVAVINADVTT
jgi:hypothetical protein